MDNAKNITNCRFCGYLREHNAERNIDIPWHANRDFSAFISQGAFIKGWTVIFPQNHLLNMSSYYRDESFWSFIEETRNKLEEVFGPTILFEHGAMKHASLTGCGTDHAHIHLVPIDIDLKAAVTSYSPSLTWESVCLQNMAEQTEEYLLFSDCNQELYNRAYFTTVEKPVSQFFRKVLASYQGIPHLFDYKADEMLDVGNMSLDILNNTYSQVKVTA